MAKKDDDKDDEEILGAAKSGNGEPADEHLSEVRFGKIWAK